MESLLPNDLLEMHRFLLTARRLEEAMSNLTSYHPAVGEEAVIVGSFFKLEDGDYVAPHYRGALVAAYMRGADLRRLIAGVHGKATAYNQGRFRGDICMPIEFNVIGLFSGILGSSVGIATGAALSLKLLGTNNVAVVTFGEGTSNLGAIHESMNLAAALMLPVIYVCQNNQYAMATSAKASMKCASVSDRAAGYGIPGIQVDGNDVVAVHSAVQVAIARARAGNGPSLIEARTYRVAGHRAGDHATYQNQEEKRQWLERDPLVLLQRRLISANLVNAAELERMNSKVQAQLDAAIAQANQDPDPTGDVLGVDAIFAPATYEGTLP